MIGAIAAGIGRIAGSAAAKGAARATVKATTTKVGKNVFKRAILKRRRIKSQTFVDNKKRYKKNVEDRKRKQKEAMLEKVPSKPGAAGAAANAPGMNFLERILNFIGTLLVGWLVNNLPKIIEFVQNLITRIKNIIETLKSFITNVTNWFVGIGKVISSAFENFLNLDFTDSSGKVSGAMKELTDSFEAMKKDIEDGKKHLTTPLGQGTGESSSAQTLSGSGESASQGSGGGLNAAQSVGGGGAYGESSLINAMNKAGINDPTERAMFLAQMAHESGNFRYDEEIASGAAYEGRRDLGNTQPGDGKRYKGRGYIQLTGRANYRNYGKKIGVDLENNPELAKRPDIAAAIALSYWDARVDRNAARSGDVRKVTYNINGGYNGLADRESKFKKYLGKTGGSGATTPNTPLVPSSAVQVAQSNSSSSTSTLTSTSASSTSSTPQNVQISSNKSSAIESRALSQERVGQQIVVIEEEAPPMMSGGGSGGGSSPVVVMGASLNSIMKKQLLTSLAYT